MLIACPACASEYEIEANLVGEEGRSVRCAACSETWFVGPEAAGEESDTAIEAIDPWDAVEFDAASAPEIEQAAPAAPVIDQPMPPPRRVKSLPSIGKPSILLVSPAIAAGLVAFVILPLIMLGRATVVRAMPRSASLFAAVGLPVNLRGVELRDVVAFRNPAEGAAPAQLVIEGDLVGVARERVAVSPIEVEVRDAHDQPLYRWTVAPPRTALEPTETARFRASLSAPPAQGSQVQVRFADAAASASRRADPIPAAPAEPESQAPAAGASHGGH